MVKAREMLRVANRCSGPAPDRLSKQVNCPDWLEGVKQQWLSEAIENQSKDILP